MKTILSLIIITLITPLGSHPMKQTTTASFHQFSIEGLLADQINMADYEGKYILCVNVASKCGYTRQYEPLQELYDQYQDKLVIIGFPSNQFGGQEPGTANEIATFCQKNYGVSFPMTQKINVKGENQHPIYSWLTQKSQNQVSDASVSWNFNKFLISPEGAWLAHFPSSVDPLGDEITSYLK